MTDFGQYSAKNHSKKFPPNQNTCQDLTRNQVKYRVGAHWLDCLQASLTDRSCFRHQIIISMDIDDDMMDVILNNKPKFVCP
jgi:hypothetical protein